MKNKKITFIDVLIIGIAAVALLFATQFFAPKKAPANKSIEFTVMISSHKNGTLNDAAVGDIVVIDYTDKYKAEITGIKSQPSRTTVFDNKNNKYVLKNSGHTQDTFITLKADARVDENVVKIGNSYIRVGQNFPIRGKGYTANGYIIKITDEQED